MQLATVMDQLGDALEVIQGLRVSHYYADTVQPPAAVIAWPDEYDFDLTLGRGADRVVIPVTVVVGRADTRTARDLLAQYTDGSGSASVKQAIEAHRGASYASARVKTVEFGAVAIAAVSYLAATFHVEIIGSGA